jgi:hypothetical protein
VVNHERTERLIHEIIAATTGRLPTTEIVNLTDEVRAHLDASIQARLELGMPAEEAELEAIACFGDPTKFVQQIVSLHAVEPPKYRALLLTMVVAITYVFTFCTMTYYNMPLLYIGLALATSLFAYYSWRGRTFQWKRLSLAGIATTLALSAVLGFSWVSLWNAGGMGESPRWQLHSLVKEETQQISAISQAYKEVDPIKDTFLAGRPNVERSPYYTNGSYLRIMFVEKPGGGPPGHLLRWTTDYSQALGSWKNYHQYWRGQWERVEQEAQANIDAAPIAASKIFEWRTAYEGLFVGILLTLAALVLNLIVSALRSLQLLAGRTSPRREIVQ